MAILVKQRAATNIDKNLARVGRNAYLCILIQH